VQDYRFVVQTEPAGRKTSYPPQPETLRQPDHCRHRPGSPRATKPTPDPFRPFLNPRYTFDNFIKGDSNNWLARRFGCVHNPGGTSFNPLSSTVGRAWKDASDSGHRNHVLANGKANRVIYVSSEKFTVEFVDAIQSDRINDFNNFYRSMDVLMWMTSNSSLGKEKTQDSFFHTFNELHQSASRSSCL